jgi:uncharacterized protein YgbK (DUF1537 family)
LIEESMLRLGIIADDLTGAMDTGLQCSKFGLETLVSMTWRQLPDAKVVVVDTNSRAAMTSVAYQRLLAVSRLAKGLTLYKKVESTMRGNVGFELRALCQALRPRCVVVAPAFPRGGRTTLWGYQRVNGKPLELTYFAHDPRWPMRESHLPTLLMQQAGKEVGHVGVESVARGTEAVASALRGRTQELVVVDALEQVHLRSIAEALVRLGDAWLPCGSAGLAEEWVRALGISRSVPLVRPPVDAGPVLVVCGSRNEVTASQLSRASRELGLPLVELDPQRCYDEERERERLSGICLAALGKGGDVILTASFSPFVAGAGAIIARVLSGAAKEIASRHRLGGLFLAGGDIAMATCRSLGVRALRLAEEVQPGIPGGRLVGGTCDGLWVVTKAGGFGDEEALLDALAYLHGERPSSAG